MSIEKTKLAKNQWQRQLSRIVPNKLISLQLWFSQKEPARMENIWFLLKKELSNLCFLWRYLYLNIQSEILAWLPLPWRNLFLCCWHCVSCIILSRSSNWILFILNILISPKIMKMIGLSMQIKSRRLCSKRRRIAWKLQIVDTEMS